MAKEAARSCLWDYEQKARLGLPRKCFRITVDIRVSRTAAITSLTGITMKTPVASTQYRTGQGPDNMTRLRRFAVGVIKSKGVRSVAQKMRELSMNTRMVFDYLK